MGQPEKTEIGQLSGADLAARRRALEEELDRLAREQARLARELAALPKEPPEPRRTVQDAMNAVQDAMDDAVDAVQDAMDDAHDSLGTRAPAAMQAVDSIGLQANLARREAGARIEKYRRGRPESFAHGFNGYKLFWVFFLSCFLGVLIEIAYVWLRTGVLMNRTGMVWGPFNQVYGIGAFAMTLLCHKLMDRNDRYIFGIGCLFGGSFEYACSWLQETITGTVSWDYSDMPLNIGGRTNLLYCMFWGVLTLVWVKGLYPMISYFIETQIKNSWGIALTLVLGVFIFTDLGVSGVAVYRMSERTAGIPAQHLWQEAFDDWFPDEKLARIYPSMVQTEAANDSTVAQHAQELAEADKAG